MQGDKKYIYVFADQGVNFITVLYRLEHTLSRLPLTDLEIKCVKREDLLDKSFNSKDVLGLFLPGTTENGAYDERLQPDGLAAIQNYVKTGGTFVGICAGAYYASSRLEWRLDDQDPGKGVVKHPGLDFFNGIAKGPMTSFVADDKWNQMKPIKIDHHNKDNNIDRFNAIYWGGPRFVSPDNYKYFNIIASYNDRGEKSPCVLKRLYGQGEVILSSIHPEISVPVLERLKADGHEIPHKLLFDLRGHQNSNRDLWFDILTPIVDKYLTFDQKRSLSSQRKNVI